jgi:hypothetical protein
VTQMKRLSEDQKQLILGGNAMKLLKIGR